MTIYTKEGLIGSLLQIRDRGWIPSQRSRTNAGAVGNTLEDLLGITENNLAIPNAAEWELKAQRRGSGSLTTLFHTEPSPRAMGFVSQIFLPLYGWKHRKAGIQYPENEMSFRQTINALTRTDRGFKIIVDRSQEKILVSFDAESVSPVHKKWLDSVALRVGLSELSPQPYWGFNDLYHIAGTKLVNMFYVIADRRLVNGNELFHYNELLMLAKFDKQRLINAVESGNILVDFDARTGHNHGTKFRFRQNKLPDVYDEVTRIF